MLTNNQNYFLFKPLLKEKYFSSTFFNLIKSRNDLRLHFQKMYNISQYGVDEYLKLKASSILAVMARGVSEPLQISKMERFAKIVKLVSAMFHFSTKW